MQKEKKFVHQWTISKKLFQISYLKSNKPLHIVQFKTVGRKKSGKKERISNILIYANFMQYFYLISVEMKIIKQNYLV